MLVYHLAFPTDVHVILGRKRRVTFCSTRLPDPFKIRPWSTSLPSVSPSDRLNLPIVSKLELASRKLYPGFGLIAREHNTTAGHKPEVQCPPLVQHFSTSDDIPKL